MIETVISIELPIDEKMTINKNRITPINGVKNPKRICIVTGTHGDELEGQYVCYELNKIISENIELLNGIVDIYPALNPLGIDCIDRGIPMFDLDMNRIFPGSENGIMPEYVASRIVKDIQGANLCIDIHASNIFLREIPQVRISMETEELLLPYAKLLNTDFIWIHASATVLASTLAHSLNVAKVPTLVVEMGVGMRITKEYCSQLVIGILNLMKEIGIWHGNVDEVKEPIVSSDGEVSFINAEASGIFLPTIKHGDSIKKGNKIGEIINPLTGTIENTVISPCDGMIFTLREYPVVYCGALIARVLGGDK